MSRPVTESEIEALQDARNALMRPKHELEEYVWGPSEDQAEFGDFDAMLTCFSFICGAMDFLDLELSGLRRGELIDTCDLDIFRNARTLIRWSAVYLARIAKDRNGKVPWGEHIHLESNSAVLAHAAASLGEFLDKVRAENHLDSVLEAARV